MGRRFKETGTAQPARQDEQDIVRKYARLVRSSGSRDAKAPAADAAVHVDASTTRTGVTMSPRHSLGRTHLHGRRADGLCLDQTTMVASLPVIMAEFGINPTTGQWLTTAYVLCIGIMMPLSAFLMARHHVRHLFALALGVFFAGAMIGAFQHNFAVLVLGRCVQACGAGTGRAHRADRGVSHLPLQQARRGNGRRVDGGLGRPGRGARAGRRADRHAGLAQHLHDHRRHGAAQHGRLVVHDARRA